MSHIGHLTTQLGLWQRSAIGIIYFAYRRRHSLLSPESPLHERAPATLPQP